MMVKALGAIQVQQLQHQVNELNFFLNISVCGYVLQSL
jgi:hypothetical protein